MKILHITDFHIDNPASDDEYLREGYYKTYIDLFVKSFEYLHTIDYLVVTGDIVNLGNSENFAHGQKIIDYLLQKLNISPQKVGMCIGNHDYNKAMETANNFEGARKAFTDFRSKYVFADMVSEIPNIAKLYKDENIYLLEIDSTYHDHADTPVNRPSKLTTATTDKLIEIFRIIPKDKPLIVARHYPIVVSATNNSAKHEDNWEEKHLFKSARGFFDNVLKAEYRDEAPTYWLFGDGHEPDFRWLKYHPQHFYMMTGMFGGGLKQNSIAPTKSYHKITEARIIEISPTNLSEQSIHTVQIDTDRVYQTMSDINWEVNSSKINDRPDESIKLSNIKEKIKDDKSNTFTVLNHTNDSISQVICKELEGKILEQIKNKGLYSIGRYAISDNDVSLGWIPIHKLFENITLLSSSIDKATKWLQDSLNIDFTKTILVGIDSWGAIFAGQMGLKKNVKNYCVAQRAKGNFHTTFEKIDFLKSELETNSNIEYIVFIEDVISSGNTISQITKELESCIIDFGSKKLIVLSVISDLFQKRKIDFGKFYGVGTLCGSLRIPIIAKDELPDESILPIKFDIRGNNTY